MIATKKELNNFKLSGIKSDDLKELCLKCGIKSESKASDNIKKLIDIDPEKLDSFIKEKYTNQVTQRRKLISDSNLIKELGKVENFKWGIVQGQLDQKIQTEYVRRYYKLDDLLSGIHSQLHSDITGYVVASWFNHWTTVLIEDHISEHPKIIPTLKNNFGVDIFFDNQPFDLKITYLPKNYSLEMALQNPKGLIVWLYENQGAQRFGSDNRLYVVLASKNKLEDSWKLKRDFDFVFKELDNFFNMEKVSKGDEIVFSFKGKSYATISKILIISK
jgi:hypothetical protein